MKCKHKLQVYLQFIQIHSLYLQFKDKLKLFILFYFLIRRKIIKLARVIDYNKHI